MHAAPSTQPTTLNTKPPLPQWHQKIPFSRSKRKDQHLPFLSDLELINPNSDVLTLLETTRPLFKSYLRIRSTATSPSNPELLDSRAELESTLTDLSSDLRDLIASVQAIEHDPYRYGLEVDEVSRRRKLVEDVGKEVEDMHAELAATVENAGPGKGLPHPSQFDSEDEEGDGEGGYEQFEQQRQEQIMQQQDEALDDVFKTVGTLRAQADTMGRELEEQADLLDDVDNIADRVGGKLQNGIKKIGWVIRKNEGTLRNSLSMGQWTDVCFYRYLLELLHCGFDSRLDHTVDPPLGVLTTIQHLISILSRNIIDLPIYASRAFAIVPSQVHPLSL